MHRLMLPSPCRPASRLCRDCSFSTVAPGSHQHSDSETLTWLFWDQTPRADSYLMSTAVAILWIFVLLAVLLTTLGECGLIKQAKGCVQVSRYIQNISYCSIQLLYLRGKKNQATGSNKVEKEEIRHIQMSELLTAHSMEHCFRCFVKGHEVSILRVYIHTFRHAKKHTTPWEIFGVSTGLHLKELLGTVWHYGNPHLSL